MHDRFFSYIGSSILWRGILLLAFNCESIFEVRQKCNVFFISVKVAQDYGGPRKEFFLMMLRAIKDKYFDGSLKIAFAEDYYLVGILFGINVPQQGFSLGAG